MGMCNYGDKFQDKLDKLLGRHPIIRKYVDDILVLIKGDCTKHIDIGYVVIQEGTKPNTNSLQGIIGLRRPTINKQ